MKNEPEVPIPPQTEPERSNAEVIHHWCTEHGDITENLCACWIKQPDGSFKRKLFVEPSPEIKAATETPRKDAAIVAGMQVAYALLPRLERELAAETEQRIRHAKNSDYYRNSRDTVTTELIAANTEIARLTAERGKAVAERDETDKAWQEQCEIVLYLQSQLAADNETIARLTKELGTARADSARLEDRDNADKICIRSAIDSARTGEKPE